MNTKNLPPVVGFCGYAGAGKDTAAAVLVKYFGYVQESFAGPLKEAALALDPIVSVFLTKGGDAEYLRLSEVVKWIGWEGAKSLPEVRRTLQRFGTEVVRNLFDPKFWIRKLELKLWKDTSKIFVISDPRFENEGIFIGEYDGLLVWIDRPELDKVNEHSSESGVLRGMADVILVNDGTVEEFQKKVRELVKSYG